MRLHVMKKISWMLVALVVVALFTDSMCRLAFASGDGEEGSPAGPAIVLQGDISNLEPSDASESNFYRENSVTVTEISLDCTVYALRVTGERQTRQTVTTVIFSDQTTESQIEGVIYTSDNEEIAAVDSQGMITAIAEGRTVVRAEYQDHHAQADVYVLPPEPDESNELIVKEGSFPPAGALFADDFEAGQLNNYYDYFSTWGRFNRDYSGGIGRSPGMISFYGYYSGDPNGKDGEGHPKTYGTWLSLAVGKTPDNSSFKPVGDPNMVERELYWRFYIKNNTEAVPDTMLGTSPIAQISGYGEAGDGTRTPFMSVNVYYPDDNSGVLVSDLKTGVFDGEGKPIGTAESEISLRGTMPVMRREFAGQWHMVEIHVKLNDDGQSNGEYDLWVNGQLQAGADDLNWAGNYEDYGINDFTIYNTNNQFGVPGGDEEFRMFDNMVISRTKIGPAGAINRDNADLTVVKSSVGKRIPDKFDPSVTEYTVEVERGTESLHLVAESAHPDSTIRVGEVIYDSGDGIPVTLQNGAATVSIEVTSPDGVNHKTYIIHVVYRKPYLIGEASDPKDDWIFWDDFEEDHMDKYFERTSRDQFYRAEGVGIGGSSGMKAEFRAADGEQHDTGAIKVAFGRTPHAYMNPVGAVGEDLREVYFRYYVKHESDWEGGGGDKMSRLSAMQSPDWAQTAIAHVWSGINDGKDYLIAEPVSGTDTEGNLKSTHWNDFENHRYMGGVRSDIKIFDADHVGEWYAIEARVKLNDPGQSNGIFQVWVDDHLEISKTNLNWIGSYEIGPEKGYGFNWFALENYWNAGTPKDQVRYFDNLVISRSKIGLAEIPSEENPDYALSIGSETSGDAGKVREITIGGRDAGDLNGKYLIVQFTEGNGEAAKVSVVMISPESPSVKVSYPVEGTEVKVWLAGGMPDLIGEDMGFTIYAHTGMD